VKPGTMQDCFDETDGKHKKNAANHHKDQFYSPTHSDGIFNFNYSAA
jgi:hypothetical protein